MRPAYPAIMRAVCGFTFSVGVLGLLGGCSTAPPVKVAIHGKITKDGSRDNVCPEKT